MVNKNNEAVLKIFETAAKFYHQNLFSDAGKASLEYLQKQRKRTTNFLKKQKYGCVNGRSLKDELYKKEFSDDDILNSGLVSVSDSGKVHDFFWKKGSVVYPVMKNNKVCDFFVKDYLTDKKSKDRADYQLPNENKIDTPLFYGQDEIKNYGEVILVEGQEDRNTIMQNSNIKAACTYGGFSYNQIEWLKTNRSGCTLLLAFDNDDAGDAFFAKAIIELFGTCKLKVIVWPREVKDLDDYLKKVKDPAGEIEKLAKESRDAFTYYIKEVLEVDANGNTEDQLCAVLDILARETGEISKLNYMDIVAEKFQLKGKKRTALNRMLKTVENKEAAPPTEKGIYEQANCYFDIVRNKGAVKISNFVMRLLRIIMIDDEQHYEVSLQNIDGEYSYKPLLLSPDEQTNWRRFKKAVKGQGRFHYLGDDRQLSEILMKEEIEAEEVPQVHRIKRYGYVAEYDLWLFHNCAIKNGKVYPAETNGICVVDGVGFQAYDVNVYSGDKPILNLDVKCDKKFIKKTINNFWTMWDSNEQQKPYISYRGFNAIAYLAAMAYRPEWLKKQRIFPNLFSFGPVETGKSEAVKILMNCFGFHHEGSSWRNSSVVGITNTLEQLSCLPFWLEEYTNSGSGDKKQDDKIAIIREAFFLSSPVKGSLGNKNVNREVNTSFILAGQDYFTDKACQSRTITLRKERPGDIATASYYDLVNDREKLSSIFLWLLKNKTNKTIKTVMNNFDKCKVFIKKEAEIQNAKISERTLINFSMLVASFSAFNYHEHDAEYLRWIVSETIHAKARESEADVVFRFFEDVSVIYRHKESLGNVVRRDLNEVHIYLHQIYSDWQTLCRSRGHQEFISEQMLRDYLKHAPEGYWVGNNKRTINHRERRCVTLDYSKLPSKLTDFVDGWDIQI